MWRLIPKARASVARHARSMPLQNPYSPSQVFSKTLHPIPKYVATPIIAFPKFSFSCQNTRFLSQSLINPSNESESDDNHPNADHSRDESQIETMSSQNIDPNVVFEEAHDVTSTEKEELLADFDGTSENNDAQMDIAGSIDQPVGEGSEESNEIDVEKLENVLSLLQSTLDRSLEGSLDDMGLSLNDEFVIRVLQTPLVPGDHLIRFFKWASKRNDFTVSAPAVDALARAIGGELKKKHVYALWDLIQEIGEKETGVINTEILNELISMFWKLGRGKAAFEALGKFERFGCVANAETYYNTLEALGKRSMYDWASSVCEKMLNAGILPDNEKIGSIISLLCKGQRTKEAHVIYLAAKEQKQYLPLKAINFLISSLSKVDETVPLALEMLDEFSGEVRKHAINPFSSVVRGLCRIKDIDGAKSLLSKMVEAGPPPGNAVFNYVISCLSKDGCMEDAMKILRLMESRGLKPDVYTYSVIMSGYTKDGLMEEACKVFAEAKKKHRKLCPATYHTLIRAYCKLKEYNKALELLSEMKDYGVEPNVDEYNKLIQSLCLDALDWKTAEKLLEEMKQKGMYLPGITRGLVNAVRELETEALGNVVEASVPT